VAWVTWRQHRFQLLVVGAVLGTILVAAAATGVPMHSAYGRDSLASCLPPAARSGCEIVIQRFESQYAGLADSARYLIVLPALAALFVGVPLLTRELEHGTYRFAWAQAVTRTRWLLVKVALLGLAAVGAGVVLSLVVAWWRRPFDELDGRMSPAGFEIQGLVVPAYTLAALALGVLAAALLRRTLPAMLLALAVFVVARLSVGTLLRPRFADPLHQTAPGIAPVPRGSNWILHDSLVDAVGRVITTGREDVALRHAQQAGIDANEYLVSLGWRRAVTYQPGDRFWTFQALEAGLFVALALVCIAGAVWALRRRIAA
jgi:hypothetical protein